MRIVVLLLAGCGDPLQRVLDRDGDAEAGARVFSETCARCHGPDGAGTDSGVDLTDGDDSREEIADKVLYGWGSMDGFEGTLSVREVADVVAFVEGLKP